MHTLPYEGTHRCDTGTRSDHDGGQGPVIVCSRQGAGVENKCEWRAGRERGQPARANAVTHPFNNGTIADNCDEEVDARRNRSAPCGRGLTSLLTTRDRELAFPEAGEYLKNHRKWHAHAVEFLQHLEDTPAGPSRIIVQFVDILGVREFLQALPLCFVSTQACNDSEETSPWNGGDVKVVCQEHS